jgi:hypothetical protein
MEVDGMIQKYYAPVSYDEIVSDYIVRCRKGDPRSWQEASRKARGNLPSQMDLGKWRDSTLRRFVAQIRLKRTHPSE